MLKRILGLALLVHLSTAVAAGTAYVHSLKAPLLAAPQFGAKTVDTLKRGDKLVVTESRAHWYQVRADGHTGWVATLLVGEQPPVQRRSYITGNGPEIRKNARRRASAVTTAGAARGLADTSRARLNGDQASDYTSLAVVEAYKTPDDQALQFVDKVVKP